MSDRERRNTMKSSSLKISNSGSEHPDILQANETPSKALPDPHSSKVGKECVGVKRDRANSPTFKDILGTNNEEAGAQLLLQALRTIPKLDLKGDLETHEESVQAILRGIGPSDELEGLLGVQMFGVHHVAMNFLALGRDQKSLLSVCELSQCKWKL